MVVQPFLRRLVVIGADNQHAIGTGSSGIFRQTDGLGRAVRSSAGNHRHAARRLLDANLDAAVMLFMRQGRRFTGRADRHQAMRAVFDLEIDKFPECSRINLAVAERRDQCGIGPVEGRCGSILRHGISRFLAEHPAVSKRQRLKIGVPQHDDKQLST